MKILICGLGSIGRRHFRNLKVLGKNEIVFYRTHQATLPDSELAGYPTYTDLNAALKQGFDGVIVSNPTSIHMPVALAAAKAGASLLIEKPVSHTLEGLPELATSLFEHGKQALIGYHFRHHPVLIAVKKLIAEGKLGKILSAQAHWGEYLPGWHPYEDYRKTYAGTAALGGGVTLTLSHPIDYLRWLLGDVEAVSASFAKVSDLEIDVEDNAEITLHFKNGAVGEIHLDYYQRPASHWLEITGSLGRVQWDNANGAAKVYSVENEAWQLLTPPAGFERNDLFLAEMRHFLEVCQGAKPACSLEDGIEALRIALMAADSSHHLSKLVQLDHRWRLDGKIVNKSYLEEKYDLKRS